MNMYVSVSVHKFESCTLSSKTVHIALLMLWEWFEMRCFINNIIRAIINLNVKKGDELSQKFLRL